tara:strand:- start:698 stop:904 length:207 start_codon:yes stop_codon:yes gene_type:complete
VSLQLKLHGADITAIEIHPIVGELLARNFRLNRIEPVPFVATSGVTITLTLGHSVSSWPATFSINPIM